ncbi:L,D-transpeptidase catalytic domain [Bradyrhizobium lablabi]|uniref:L,D-transpeptidase catalytic domain n=2 Tax=Bradyrhizobium TaxID=374 RepID=A0ABY0P5N2_9BRAD|nr:L,D-transpeptidase catalytic domain [Bradyrhizobium ottawaense]SEE33200.1 L,D-transpeptidase catalytic domain [Bradyrhizobium lablabi]SHM29691.1 L,D-transpeptidase catalytic domain [Bradyrhizobium lablabi]
MSGHRILSAASAHVKVAEQRSKSVGFWQIAVLTAAGTLGAASQADAALFYYQDSDSGYSRPTPSVQPRRQRNTRKNSAGKQAAEKETGAKPQGPLIIAVSIDKQKVRIYDSRGLFAESPVSTGMKGHSTPMGVFSIIQKHKFHHSNIYSGAPMPYMQRITWSGIAMHAGVLPGYPASHGCIRMPMAFAVKMWNWTKMGARVVVTPGEMTPASFSHPLLVAQKIAPQPVVADEPKSDLIKSDLPKADMPAVKSDKGADAGPGIKSENSVASLELRSTVGHASALREQTQTADASGDMSAANAAVTMSDPTGGKSSSSEAVSTEARPEAPKSESRPEAESTSANSADTASSDNKSAEASIADAKSDETGSVEKKTDEAEAPTPPAADAAKTETASDGAKVQEKAEDKPVEGKVEAKSAEKPDEAKADAAKAEVKAEPVTVEAAKPEVTKADASAAPDAKKDTARLPGVEKAAAAKAEPKRTGQIAVFVSRKDSKLYVRQNFAPLFDVPITIAPSDRPLGTHVFTAEADKSDPNLLRWSVVTLPVTARNAARNDADDDRPARRRKMAGGAPAEVKPRPVPDSPAEALDRIAIPQDAMARITEALTTGSSIIVSDQGINQGETGEGTDFIVSLR